MITLYFSSLVVYLVGSKFYTQRTTTANIEQQTNTFNDVIHHPEKQQMEIANSAPITS